MNTPLAEHHERCAEFAAGALTAADRRAFVEHLAYGCEDCEAALPEYERATVLLAAALPMSAPDPSVRERLLDQGTPVPLTVAIAAAKRRRKRTFGWPRFQPPPRVIALAAGIGIGVAALAFYGAWHYRQLAQYWRSEATADTKVIHGLNDQLQDAIRWGGMFTEYDMHVVQLASTRSDVLQTGRAMFDSRESRATFVFDDLAAAPAGNQYRIWAVEGTHWRAVATFDRKERGRAVVRANDAGDPMDLTEFAVSLEPEAAASADGPTGPVVMRGPIGR
jgi:anti-sigma-K factor RskA